MAVKDRIEQHFWRLRRQAIFYGPPKRFHRFGENEYKHNIPKSE
jgi:hypothetical protein